MLRAAHPALQQDRTLRFHHSENPNLLVYSKSDPEAADAVLVVVNLDPHHAQHGWIDVDVQALGLEYDAPYHVHDELGDEGFDWRGAWNWVRLDPAASPAHVFVVRKDGAA